MFHYMLLYMVAVLTKVSQCLKVA